MPHHAPRTTIFAGRKENSGLGNVWPNASKPDLWAKSLIPKDGVAANIGLRGGKSPTVEVAVWTASIENPIWWGNDAAMSRDAFDRLWEGVTKRMKDRDLFAQVLFKGADPDYRLKVRIVAGRAWHSLCLHHLLHRPKTAELDDLAPDLTIINCPSFKADPVPYDYGSETVLVFDSDHLPILIGSTAPADKTRKAAFTRLNGVLPEKGVMPTQCLADRGFGVSDDTAIGDDRFDAGKTISSAAPSRYLIGDDEQGVMGQVLFSFESGCCARTIKLDPDAAPKNSAKPRTSGTVVAIMGHGRDARAPDFADDSLKPPMAPLTPVRAAYHFLSRFALKVTGTEQGMTDPDLALSTCPGAPFVPRRPAVHGAPRSDKTAAHGVTCWRANTGRTGGAARVGAHVPIPTTKDRLAATRDGLLNDARFHKEANIGFDLPLPMDRAAEVLLDPRGASPDKAAYELQARRFLQVFSDSFAQFPPFSDETARTAATGRSARFRAPARASWRASNATTQRQGQRQNESDRDLLNRPQSATVAATAGPPPATDASHVKADADLREPAVDRRHHGCLAASRRNTMAATLFLRQKCRSILCQDLVMFRSHRALWDHFLAGRRSLCLDKGHDLAIETANKTGRAVVVGSAIPPLSPSL